jgi:hypothetical protein
MACQAVAQRKPSTGRSRFVNPTLANHALARRARLFRYGTVSYHGAFVGLSFLAGVQALRIDPKYWQVSASPTRASA